MNGKSAFESLIILIIVIAGIAVIPGDQFREWYSTNKAQITVTPTTGYYKDDVVGNLFSWIGDNVFVPTWNYLFANDAIRNLVAPTIAAAIIGGLAYDVLKSFLRI